MKNILFILSFILCYSTVKGQSIVQFSISKPYCLLNFMETVAGGGHTSATLRKYIADNIPATDTAFSRLTNEFRNLKMDYTYERDEYPASRHRNRSTQDLIIIAAVQSSDLPKFKRRTVGILPNSEHKKLFDILAAAEVYYDKLIWDKYYTKLQKQVEALQEYDKQASELFTVYKNFYRSSWTNDIPFKVALYAIPGERGHSTASPHANSLCVGVMTDEKNHSDRIGVVMHEICHVLYDEQPAPIQIQLDSMFNSSRSAYRQYAYNYFDEALATALGNGYAYRYITGKEDTSEWYNNKYINGFGHALYPLAVKYIQAGRQLDKAFVDDAIKIFVATFPQAKNDYGILFNRVRMYADAESEAERNELFSIVGNHFQVTYFSLSTPVLEAESIEGMKTIMETQVILVDRNADKTMDTLQKIFPEIRGYMKGRKHDNYILSFFDSIGRPIIIVKATQKGMLEKAFTTMAAQQYINPARPYQPIDIK